MLFIPCTQIGTGLLAVVLAFETLFAVCCSLDATPVEGRQSSVAGLGGILHETGIERLPGRIDGRLVDWVRRVIQSTRGLGFTGH